MNTLEELIENGFEEYTAIQMLNSYTSKIGTLNGIYEITDITYDFKQRGRDVTLKCTVCGNEIHRMMIKGRNKWSELIKTCSCQKEMKDKALENLKNEKMALIESRVGKVYGDYEIISVEDLDDIPKYVMKCITCGFEKTVSASAFDRLNFECHKHFNPIKYDDSYIGKKYNFLEILGFEYDDKSHRMAKCRCDCNNVKLIIATNVVNGTVKSCGCMTSKLLHDAFWKEDALNRQRLYRIWTGMKQRCYNPNCDNYPDYGGRGITICDEWLGNYEAFKDWALSHGYSDNLSIDRINVNGNYEPSNCRWATMKVQANNKRPKRRTVQWTINGYTRDAKEWCKVFGISYETVMYRVSHKGMSIYDALTTPKMTEGRPTKGSMV